MKKASRELNNQTSKLDDIQKIEALQKRCADLFAEMKRLERDNLKNKKRGDQLQKEKDHGRTELGKNVTLREKLEKLCRELQRENNRLKVGNLLLRDAFVSISSVAIVHRRWIEADSVSRVRIRHCKIQKSETMKLGTASMKTCSGSCKIIKKTRTTLRRRL